MDGSSVLLSVLALFVGVWYIVTYGHDKRCDFNYKSGQAIAKCSTAFPEKKLYRKVILRCLFLPVVGWLFLIGWWWAEDTGLQAGKDSIGKVPEPK